MGLSSGFLREFLPLLLLAYFANASTAKVLNVNNFGAIADSKTDSTQAFLNAWKEACGMEGSPRILIPEGAFLVGLLKFNGPCKGRVIVQIKGVLKAQRDLSVFKADPWITFDHVDGLVITGGGVFDGQGATAWPQNQCAKANNCKLLPTSIKFNSVTNATIRRISSVDSKSFHMTIDGSKDMKIHQVKITAPEDSPNTDGIHIGGSTNVKISHSFISTGDDCISLGPGSVNVTVSNVFCGPGHGISVGSLGKYPNEADVHGLRVRNCTLTGTTNGVRIKTWQASPSSSASDLAFEKIVMKNVENPIIIDQEYCPHNRCSENAPSKVRISKIKFHNIIGTSASKVAVKLLCSQAVPCQGVELSDINLKYFGDGDAAASSSCANVEGVSTSHVIPPPCI